MDSAEGYASFDQVKARLDEIVDAVSADGVSLDEALSLYEEAVKLGLSACDLSERDAEAILAAEDAQKAEEPAAESDETPTEE